MLGAAPASKPEPPQVAFAVPPQVANGAEAKSQLSRKALQVPAPRRLPEDWTRQKFLNGGLVLSLPDGMFTPRLIADDRQDIVYSADDRRTLLRIYGGSGPSNTSLEALRRRLLSQRYEGAELLENRLLDDGLVLAGPSGW